MGKADEVLKQLILHHGKRIAKAVVGELPTQVKQTRYDIRSLQKDVARVMREMDQLREAARKKAPVPAASEDQLKGARLTKRTLPALRKRSDLTQGELAKLLQVSVVAVGSWERSKSRPRAASVAKIIALRSMSPEQVDAALGRQEATVPAMPPQQIKGLREKLGWSRQELGEHLGVWAVTVGTWQRGRSAPGAANRAALAQIKAMTQEELDRRLGRTGTPTARTASAAQTVLSPEEFRRIREEAGLSQRELSKKLGVSVNTVSSWERGSTSPRQESVQKLLAIRE